MWSPGDAVHPGGEVVPAVTEVTPETRKQRDHISFRYRKQRNRKWIRL